MTTEFKFEPKQRVKHVETGNEGAVGTCALDSHGQIFYVEFPEKNISNHWFRPDLLRAVD